MLQTRIATDAVNAPQVRKARTSAGLVARPATGRTTVIERMAVIAWVVAVVVAVAAVMIDEGATHADAVADRHHPVTGMSIDAGAGVDLVRVALASYVKAAASSAMRRATSSATAQSTAEVAGQCTAGGQTATETVVTDTKAGGHRIQEAAHPLRIVDTTTEEAATWVVAADAWTDPHPGGTTTVDRPLRKRTGRHPGGTTTADRLHRKRTGPVATTAASATEE